MSRGGGGAGHGFANDMNNVAEMFARGELRDDPAVVGMEGHLGGDDVGKRRSSGTDDGGGGLVAGAFDAKDQATLFERGHVPILMVTQHRYEDSVVNIIVNYSIGVLISCCLFLAGRYFLAHPDRVVRRCRQGERPAKSSISFVRFVGNFLFILGALGTLLYLFLILVHLVRLHG